MSKRKRFDLKPQKIQPGSSLRSGDRDILDALHRFENTGLVGLKTAGLAALATAGQPLAGILQSGRRLLTEHLGQQLNGACHIPLAQARELSRQHDLTIPRLMQELIPIARGHARASISHYRVGVVAQGTTGDLYLGFNLEFPDCPLVHTVNAEQCAVLNAFSHGERGLRSLSCPFAPSGLVRQFLYELPAGGDLKIFLPDRAVRLKALLPNSFGPRDLGSTGALMNSERQNLEFEEEVHDTVAWHALEAAARSYAPYSQCPAGIALATDEQSFAGSYVENVAFNPSMSPLQGALISLYCNGKQSSDIRRAVLVERSRIHAAQVQQGATTRHLLSVLAPQAEVQVLHCRVLVGSGGE